MTKRVFLFALVFILSSGCKFRSTAQSAKPLTEAERNAKWAAKLKALPVSNPRRVLASKTRLTTLHVTVATDNNPGGFGDVGDLRWALNTMNTDLNAAPDDYAIVFDFPMTIQLNGILPIVNNSPNAVNITIGNSGSTPTVTIDGNSGSYSGFFIPMGNVTIQNIIFQNLTAKGGNGGDGISGGGGGLGAGGAIFAPTTFLNGSNPDITLINVSITNSSAVGGNGGNYIGGGSTGDEGGGGGGGLAGNGGSVTTNGSTGGGGGGGFGGDGGNATQNTGIGMDGGGGGGGGGIGSRAALGTLENLGHGGPDDSAGADGNGYGLTVTAGTGGGGHAGGSRAGGGGGGGGNTGATQSGGGGGGSLGTDGNAASGGTPPGGGITSSGGLGGDGAGGGGGGIVAMGVMSAIDGSAGLGGYGGGGGGGAGTGFIDTSYTVRGATGGMCGGGGGGGVDVSGTTSAEGGNSTGGGGGGGGGPSNGGTALGGNDTGNLGGGAGGSGSNNIGAGFGGGGGGGGSGLGGAIFVDSNLNFRIGAFSSVPTSFNTSSNSVVAGTHGSAGAGGGTDGLDGSAQGDSIFMRSGSTVTLNAASASDLLTVGTGVSFTDDTNFGGGGTNVMVTGDGTVTYNGTSSYQGSVKVDNANFKVNGTLNQATVFVCRNSGSSSQKGKLSGTGTLTGDVFANSGVISPEAGGTLTIGSLTLNSPSVVHVDVDNAGGTSSVAVTGAATLSGTLEVALDADAQMGTYTVLTSSAITGTFDTVLVTGRRTTPNYEVTYVPDGAPTSVRITLTTPPSTPDPTPKTSGSGSGVFTSGGKEINFKSTAGYNAKHEIVASLFYNDPTAKVHFDNPVVTALDFTGNHVTFSGTVRVKNEKVTFTYTMTDNTAPTADTISLTLGNGYSASGSLTSGGVDIQ